MWGLLGLLLLIVGGVGVSYQCVIFVKETIPQNWGNNPGFGCLEIMVRPWFATGCIGLGLFLQSWRWGVIIFGLGLFLFGLLAMLLGHLFGGRGDE